MINAFKIGAVLELNSNVAKSLGQITQAFEKFDKQVKTSQNLLTHFADTFDKIGPRARAGAAGLTAFADAATKIGRSGTGAVRLAEGLQRIETASRSLTGLRDIAKAFNTLNTEGKEINVLARAMRVLGDVNLGKHVITVDDYANAVGRLAAHAGAIKALADSMMALGKVKMAAGAVAVAGGTNAVEQELAQRARDRQMRARSLALQEERMQGHDYHVVGMLAGQGGREINTFVGESLNKSFEMEHLRLQLLTNANLAGVGATPSQNVAAANSAVQASYDATKTAPGTSPVENLRALNDVYNVIGDFNEAKESLPAFARLTALLQLMDRRGGGKGDPAFAAEKAQELFGGMITEKVDEAGHATKFVDPQKMMQQLEMMERVAVRTNMRVTPQDYLAVAKTGELPGMNWSDEFKYTQLPAIIMAMGGQRAGTAFTSLYQVLSGDRLTPKYRSAMSEAGLATPMFTHMEIDPITHRRKKVTTGGDVYDLDILQKNPLEWVQAMQRRMEERGIHGTDAQIAEVNRFAQRSTLARLLGDMLKDMPAILKEQANIQATGGTNGRSIFEHFAQDDPTAKVQQFHAALEKLMTLLGSALMEPATKALDQITRTLNAISDFAQNHPDAAGIIAKCVGGLGLVLTALGSLSIALWALGPAIRMAVAAMSLIPGVRAAGVAAGAARTAGTVAAGVGVGVGAVAAGVGVATAGVLAVGSAYETPETQAALDKIHRDQRSGLVGAANMQTYDNYDTAGRSVAPTPSAIQSNDPNKSQPVHVTNPGDLVNGMMGGVSNRVNRPPSGPTGHDPSMDNTGAMAGAGLGP